MIHDLMAHWPVRHAAVLSSATAYIHIEAAQAAGLPWIPVCGGDLDAFRRRRDGSNQNSSD